MEEQIAMLIQTYHEPTTWKPGKALSPDQVLEKEEVHKRGLLHLSTHLLVKDTIGNMCIRKRGAYEARYTSLWTTTLGTHVQQGKDYASTLRCLLHLALDLEWVGEFRVKDSYENEVNGLYIAQATPEELGLEFMKGRYFLPLEETMQYVNARQTTPHLRKAIRILGGGE